MTLTVSALIGLLAGLLVSPSPAPLAAPSPSPAAPGLELPEPTATFGEVYAGAVVTHRFPFRNRGAKAVRITELRPLSASARATAHPEVVPPGGEGYVAVEQPTNGRLGVAGFRVALRADDGGPERKLALSGFIQSAYEPEQPELDLGTVAPGGSGTLEIFSREVDRLEVKEILDAPAFAAVDASGRAGAVQEGVVLRLALRPDAPLGFRSGVLRLRTNVAKQPEVAVAWRAGVYEDVVPSESPVDLGWVRAGQPFVKTIRLERRSGGALEVERIDTEGTAVTTELAPCPRPADSCRVLRLSGVGPALGSPLGGTLGVVVKGSRPVSLPYAGILVGADTTVKDLGALESKAEKTLTLPPVKSASSPDPAAGASAPVVGRPGERRARLTWQAQQERDAYGYLVYRSATREGPFVRINPEILRVSALPEPHVYTYVDEQVEPGHTYYYYLETMGRGGTKSRLSGVMAKVIPKAGP